MSSSYSNHYTTETSVDALLFFDLLKHVREEKWSNLGHEPFLVHETAANRPLQQDVKLLVRLRELLSVSCWRMCFPAGINFENKAVADRFCRLVGSIHGVTGHTHDLHVRERLAGALRSCS